MKNVIFNLKIKFKIIESMQKLIENLLINIYLKIFKKRI